MGAERQIKNVKDATDNQDAVTLKQLKDYVAQNGGSVNNYKEPEKDTNATIYNTNNGNTILNLGDKYEKIDYTPIKLTDKVSVNLTDENKLTNEDKEKLLTKVKEQNPTIDNSLITVDDFGNIQIAGKTLKASDNITVTNNKPITDKNLDENVYRIVNNSTDGVTITNLKDAENDKDAVNLKTLKEKITESKNYIDNTFLKKDGSNIAKDDERITLATNLSTGADLTNPKGILVTDTIVKSGLDNKANKDLSNVDSTTLTNKIIKGSITSTDLTVTGGDNATFKDVKLELSNTLKDKINSVDNKANKSDLIDLAKKDLSNVEKTTIITKVGDGNLDTTNGGLVTDEKIKEKLDLKANKSDLVNYVKRDGSNIDDKSKVNLTTKLTNGANINTPTDTIVTDRMVKTELDKKLDKTGTNLNDKEKETLLQNLGLNNILTNTNLSNKADKNANNLTKDDVNSWKDKLGINNLATNDQISALNTKTDLAIGGVANAIAIANTPQVSGKYKLMLTSGYGYFSGQHALALGVSGTDNSKKVVYKLTGAFNNKGTFALGAGLGIMLGEIDETDSTTSKEVNAKLVQYEKERKEMREELSNQKSINDNQTNQIKELYKMINELQNKLKNIK